jgi:hypothetical protein
MNRPLPSQISATDAGDQADADAGILHVGLEVAAAVARAVAARPPPLPPNRPTACG